MLERVYNALAVEGLTATDVYALDSTAVKAHLDAHGVRKNGKQATDKTRGRWNTKINAVTACDSK
jgi:hypothetical protein